MAAIAQVTNLGVRFALEMFVLTAVGLWAWRTVPGIARYAATIIAVAAIAGVWTTVVHGASVPAPLQMLAQVVVLVLATAAVATLWHRPAAAIFAGIAIANAALLALLGQ